MSTERATATRRPAWASGLVVNAAAAVPVLIWDAGNGANLHVDERVLAAQLVVTAAALLLRSVAPVPVLGVLLVVAVSRWWASDAALVEPALLVALYAVAVLRRRRIAYAAFAVYVVVALGGVALWPRHGRLPETPVLMVAAGVAAVAIGFAVRSRRDYLAAVEDRARRLEIERDQRALLAAADERARIAREMHDIVAHNLSVMVALSQGAAVAAKKSDEAADIMLEVADVGRSALADMRRLLGTLREPSQSRHPAPGLDDLDQLLDSLRAAGLHARLTLTGPVTTLAAGPQATVYRLVQESLTNVLKHASDATEVAVTVAVSDQECLIEVVDDGSGPETGEPGHGLVGMRERVAVHGGTVTAGARPGGGWHVEARLPR
ncbi:sensor histidine kinase [Cryptosporangium sp. NPDC048952]|uniref:sensor histidine kinase n=1 Tax=Cryptosporangium sp. NPDC048952 TaxID=3363961 RepID=UPI003711E65C